MAKMYGTKISNQRTSWFIADQSTTLTLDSRKTLTQRLPVQLKDMSWERRRCIARQRSSQKEDVAALQMSFLSAASLQKWRLYSASGPSLSLLNLGLKTVFVLTTRLWKTSSCG